MGAGASGGADIEGRAFDAGPTATIPLPKIPPEFIRDDELDTIDPGPITEE